MWCDIDVEKELGFAHMVDTYLNPVCSIFCLILFMVVLL